MAERGESTLTNGAAGLRAGGPQVPMSSEEIAQLWRNHYAHRRYDPWSRVICELIRVIVSDRARTKAFERARAELGILKREWDEF